MCLKNSLQQLLNLQLGKGNQCPIKFIKSNIPTEQNVFSYLYKDWIESWSRKSCSLMTDAVSIGNCPSELNKVEDTAQEIFWNK